MCKAIREMEQIYTKKGEEIGKDNALITAIKMLIKNTRQPYDEVCTLMGLSDADRQRYSSMI